MPGHIRCPVCGRPVDRVSAMPTPHDTRHTHVLVYTHESIRRECEDWDGPDPDGESEPEA